MKANAERESFIFALDCFYRFARVYRSPGVMRKTMRSWNFWKLLEDWTWLISGVNSSAINVREELYKKTLIDKCKIHCLSYCLTYNDSYRLWFDKSFTLLSNSYCLDWTWKNLKDFKATSNPMSLFKAHITKLLMIWPSLDNGKSLKSFVDSKVFFSFFPAVGV